MVMHLEDDKVLNGFIDLDIRLIDKVSRILVIKKAISVLFKER